MKTQRRTFSQLITRTGMGWDPISNTVTASEEACVAAFVLCNSNTATGFLQMSSAQPAPNSDEERELDAAFLSEGLHVNVNIDGVDDVEELPTLSEAQSQRQAEK
ncbi:hypothetical protein CFP56_013027 [Quercus suber]|uniref:Uncharacterized protein n=1 Tax=Quercus suber TaxID=58331 RepID=A0AAW0M3Y0_QUESU